MRIYDNEMGGQTVTLGSGESIDAIPDSHKDLLTDEIRGVFAEGEAYFSRVAKRSDLTHFSEWLKRCSKEAWGLTIADGFAMMGDERESLVGFWLHAKGIEGATVTLALERDDSTDAFSHYYSLVDIVHWAQFGYSGGLLGRDQHIPLSAFSSIEPNSDTFGSENSRVWGNSACGDMLIHAEGRAAYLSHESSGVNDLGTVESAINWVFGELLQGRTPEFRY